MINTFVISLERSSDRKESFNKNNSKYIKNYTFFNAVDGKNIDINTLDQHIFTKNSKNYSNGAIGCALSHLALWEKCIELNEPILIMEDDAIVSHNFTKHLNNVYHNMLPKDWDILQLSYNCDSMISYHNTTFEICNCAFGKKKTTTEDITTFVHSKINTTIAKLIHSFGTSAYLVSPKGAKILKEKCFPLNNKKINVPFIGDIYCFTIDCLMNSIYKDMSAFICIIPFVMTTHLSENYNTTIQ